MSKNLTKPDCCFLSVLLLLSLFLRSQHVPSKRQGRWLESLNGSSTRTPYHLFMASYVGRVILPQEVILPQGERRRIRTDMHAGGDKVEADGLDPPAKKIIASAAVSPLINPTWCGQIKSLEEGASEKVCTEFLAGLHSSIIS